MSGSASEPVISGKGVVLRGSIPSDFDSHMRWRVQGEWRVYDAPWEAPPPPPEGEELTAARERFAAACREEMVHPRPRLTIATPDGAPLGWVNRYGKRRPHAWWVGIDICEDRYLNAGLGTEALWLWTDYLFARSDVHRLGIETWSFNPRMARVAEKLGFTPEGTQRQLLEWKGEWLDLHHYGLLRSEWERRRGAMQGPSNVGRTSDSGQ